MGIRPAALRRRNSLPERQRFLIAKHSPPDGTLGHVELVTWARSTPGVAVDRRTISKLSKRKDLILKEEHELVGDVKPSRPLRFPSFDGALYRWFICSPTVMSKTDDMLLE